MITFPIYLPESQIYLISVFVLKELILTLTLLIPGYNSLTALCLVYHDSPSTKKFI